MGKKKHEDHEEHMDETWLIPYADLLTLLLALFIVLFAVSQTDHKKKADMASAMKVAFQGGWGVLQHKSEMMKKSDGERGKQDTKKEKAQKEKEQLQQMKEKIEKALEEKGAGGLAEVRIEHDRMRVIISDKALFASGSAEIKPDAYHLALNVGDILSEMSDRKMTVSGHTDTLPMNSMAFKDNWDLSSQRALNFMRLLLKTPGMNAKNFSASGYGEFYPIASNSTQEGRERNRRVEISVWRNHDETETKDYWDPNSEKETLERQEEEALPSAPESPPNTPPSGPSVIE